MPAHQPRLGKGRGGVRGMFSCRFSGSTHHLLHSYKFGRRSDGLPPAIKHPCVTDRGAGARGGRDRECKPPVEVVHACAHIHTRCMDVVVCTRSSHRSIYAVNLISPKSNHLTATRACRDGGMPSVSVSPAVKPVTCALCLRRLASNRVVVRVGFAFLAGATDGRREKL